MGEAAAMDGWKVVIPARYASTRLPGKPLRLLAGRPMIEHVHQRALASGAEVVIATDDVRIETACRAFGADVCMTSPDHASGTARIAEVADRRGWDDDTIVVNLQGDEPLVPPALLCAVAADLAAHAEADLATLAEPITDPAELFNANTVKLVTDRDGYALYFSRAPIPWDRATFDTPATARYSVHRRHLGIYAYRAAFVRRFAAMAPSPLETIESLEQLRVLWHGGRIHVTDATEPTGPGVDTEADLVRVEALLTGAGGDNG